MNEKQLAEELLHLADLNTAQAMAKGRSRSWGTVRVSYPNGLHAIVIDLSGMTLSITRRWFRVLNGPRKTVLLAGPLSAEEGIRQLNQYADLLHAFIIEDAPQQLAPSA